MRLARSAAAASLRLVPPCALLLAALSCTNAQLYHLEDIPNEPNKIAFTGEVCTDNPAERSFPLRVVFLVDTSPDPTLGIDPAEQVTLQTRRVSAIRDSVGVLRAADTSFALVRFGGDGFITPDDGTFTDNTALISEAAGALTTPMPCSAFDGCRRTSQALSLASSLITGDLLLSLIHI